MEEERKSELILEHQLEEWKILNEYINNMDTGYQQWIVIMVSIFAGVTAFFVQTNDVNVLKIIFIVPMGLVAVFAYLSYQFRITAILRGHLATLEEKMNSELDENVHMWNSALVETFMAHNNTINNKMMMPIIIFVLLLIGYCGYLTLQALSDVPYKIVIWIIYWLVVLIGAIIVFQPFLENEKVRHEVMDEIQVMKMYKKYKKGWRHNPKKGKR